MLENKLVNMNIHGNKFEENNKIMSENKMIHDRIYGEE